MAVQQYWHANMWARTSDTANNFWHPGYWPAGDTAPAAEAIVADVREVAGGQHRRRPAWLVPWIPLLWLHKLLSSMPSL